MPYRTALLLVYPLLLSLQTAGAVEVFDSHPRLFFRDSAWGERSITTATLKQRAADPRYRPFTDDLTRRGPQGWALKALVTGDSEAARECIRLLKERKGYGNTTDAGLELMWDAMAFDWLYNNPAFGEADKQAVIANLARGARRCIEMYDSQGAHIFHTRMYGYPTGAGVAGLALAGHHPEADEFISWAYGKYRNDLFPARQIQDGAVHNSMAYGRKYTMWLVGHFIAAWYTATGENLWRTIREEQGDWAWREALFVIYGEQPDGLLVRYGDNFFRGTERFSFRVVSERAHYYDEPVGAGYLNYLLERHAGGTRNRIGTEMGNEYQVLLYWDAEREGSPREVLPPRELFGPRGAGMAFWRTGWDEDDTFIFFKCGDYFDNHGHFDAGHVEVFRRAPLLIEGGSYAGGTTSDHYRRYFHNSIAHNTILISDPDDPEDAGSQRFYNNQAMHTIGDYRDDALREYGNVTAFAEYDNLTYLAADFTAAYPDGRARRVVRELAWDRERFLVVIDNVALADRELQPRVLWHYTVEPSVGGRSFTVADGGARVVGYVLAPADAVIETVPAFTVADAVYPPRDADNASLGAGRIEVGAGRRADGSYTFVQALDIADQDAPPAAVKLLGASAGTVVIQLPSGVLTLDGKPGARRHIELK